jgi:WXG100 family type VII secretion target
MTYVTIKVVPDDFDTAHAELSGLKEALETQMESLRARYSAMSEDWNGAAADAFNEYVPGLLADYKTIGKAMDKIMANIKKVGEEMRVLDQQLAKTD